MNHPQINPTLLHKLSTLIHDTQLSSLLHRYHQSDSSQPPLQLSEHSTSAKNETTAKPKRLASNSKQRKLLFKKQSQHKFKPLPKAPLPQPPLKLQQPDPDSKKILKDKAVFINVTQLPYLHSSDLLNHLYKNSNMSPQIVNDAPFYNPPLNNTHALTKLKHLHIYYTQIQSLRDLGTGWSNLVQLSIYFGKLKDLSGLNAFPSLQYLHCPFNLIETLSDFMFHPTLVSIDLQFNQITEYSEVEHLFTVQNLEYVNLLNNPVYLNKEAKRKINQKCEKIIETENTRVEEYWMEKRREGWEIEQMEGVEYCNNVLNQFYLTCKKDDITLESKYLCYSRPDPEFDLITEEITPYSSKAQCQSNQCSVGQLKIEYIGPQIPEDAYFESMIMNGEDLQETTQPYCQQKIFMTPLTSLIDPKSVYVGPVLTKYLSNKLYIKDQKPKPKNQPPQNQSQQFTSTSTVKPNIQSLSNTLKDSQVKSVVNTLKDSSTNSVMISDSCIASNAIVSGIQTQTPSLFEKTSTSLSTNCTNLNNTSTSFGFKRARPELSKSKQKSLGKLSLLAKLTDNIGQTDLIRTSVGKTPQSQNSSLIKASRMLLGKPLIKEVTGVEDPLGRTEQGKGEKGREWSCEKGSYSTSLRRRNILGESKKERSMVLKKEQEV